MLMICLRQELFITKEPCQLEVGSQQQLGEQGSGYPILVGDLCHFPVDTLRQPSEHDEMDTGLGISIWASGKLHRMASGWCWMVMNLQDAQCKSPS
jgi:hypothetical protein